MLVFRRIIALAVFVLLLVAGWQIAARNADLVHIDYLFGEVKGVRVWLALLISFVAGGAVVAIAALFSSMRAGLLSRRYRKAIADLEAEVHQLRNLPLAVEDLTDSAIVADPEEERLATMAENSGQGA